MPILKEVIGVTARLDTQAILVKETSTSAYPIYAITERHVWILLATIAATVKLDTQAETVKQTSTSVHPIHARTEGYVLILLENIAVIVNLDTQGASAKQVTGKNNCTPNQCQNGGTCVDLGSSYQCDCVVGYDGVNCEVQDIDECEL